MATNFDENAIVMSGGIKPSTKNTPTDVRTRIESISEVESIPLPFVGMIFYVKDVEQFYVVKSLKGKKVGPIESPDSLVDKFEPLFTGLASEQLVQEAIENVELIPGPEGPMGPEGPEGPKGQDGYTPVIGVDYFTEEDIAAIKYDDSELREMINNEVRAREAFVEEKVAELVNGAPDALNSLQELAKAIEDHDDVYEAFVQVNNEELAKKVDKEEGKSLVDDVEIARLAQVDNYDDTELRGMFIVDEPQKAVFNNRPYIFACGHPLIVEGQDDEVVITYAVNDTNKEMGKIRVPAEEAKKLVIVGGFGDANVDRTRILPATHIHVRNVNIQAVYGGNLFEGIVGEANIVIENSNVKEVIGGGDAGRFIEGRWAVRNNVAKVNVKLTDVKSSLVFVGGSGGPSNVAEAHIELNGNCDVAWLTAGGSNGFTAKSEIVINGGQYECVQMTNRGLVDEAKLVMNGGHANRVYFAGEAEDATVTGIVNHVVFELNAGEIGKLARGNSNSLEFNGDIKGHIKECVVSDGDISMLEVIEKEVEIEKRMFMVNESGVEIELPEEAKDFDEIHVFVKHKAGEIKVKDDACKWQADMPELIEGRIYELIFTKVANVWLAGCIEYK